MAKMKEMEVLIAYEDEDGTKEAIAAMRDSSWKNGEKVDAMREFLMGHYGDWLDGCSDDEERQEYVEQIEEAASNLACGGSAHCCGDDLFWETVTYID